MSLQDFLVDLITTYKSINPVWVHFESTEDQNDREDEEKRTFCVERNVLCLFYTLQMVNETAR